MTRSHQLRAIKIIAVLALLSALLLLLLPHTTGSYSPQILWLTLVPLFLFGILDTRPSQWLPARANRPAKHNHSSRSALFQRPPPSA
jgi:hypothetical protein